MAIKFDGNIESIYIDGKTIGKVYIDGKLMWQKNSGPRTVLFDAVGAGGFGEHDISWPHTASGDDRAVVVSLTAFAIGAITDIVVTYGGVAMTPLTPQGAEGVPTTQFRTQQFVLLNPPAGEQTVQVAAPYSGLLPSTVCANSVSYTNVGSYTQGAYSHGSSTTRSLAVTAAGEGSMVAQAFGQFNSPDISNYSQTQRGNVLTDGPSCLLVGDAAGTGANILFTATGGNTLWSGVSVVLHPK